MKLEETRIGLNADNPAIWKENEETPRRMNTELSVVNNASMYASCF